VSGSARTGAEGAAAALRRARHWRWALITAATTWPVPRLTSAVAGLADEPG